MRKFIYPLGVQINVFVLLFVILASVGGCIAAVWMISVFAGLGLLCFVSMVYYFVLKHIKEEMLSYCAAYMVGPDQIDIHTPLGKCTLDEESIDSFFPVKSRMLPQGMYPECFLLTTKKGESLYILQRTPMYEWIVRKMSGVLPLPRIQ